MHLNLKGAERMNDLTVMSSGNYDAIAQMVGITDDMNTGSKVDSLNRLRLWHYPTMGQAEINGKLKNVEVIDGGVFRLEVIEGSVSKYVYSKTISVRPFMQRFMLKRYVANKNPKPNEKKGEFQRTIMSNTLKEDLKDTTGRFNCGKTAGYIEDFQALPADMQDLIRQIKRVRVLFGIVTMENPMDQSGKPMDEFETPFVWEIDNKDAFNSVGECMGTFARHQRTPFHHAITFTESTQHEMDNNSSYYTPVCKVDMGVHYEHTKEDDETLSHFLDWIKNKNDYVFKEWDTKNTKRQEEMPDEDMEIVEDFIDIELEEGEEK
jgi:hypothetical protein